MGRALIDTWVGGWRREGWRRLGAGARSREISLIMHSFQAAVIILHIAGGGVPTAFANFSTRPKRNGRQFGRATHASLRARLPNGIRWNLTEFDRLARLKKNISLRGNRRRPLQRGYSNLFGMSLCADVCGDGLVLNITVTENVRIRF